MVDVKEIFPSLVVLSVLMVVAAPSVTGPVKVTVLEATSRVVTFLVVMPPVEVTAKLVMGVVAPMAPLKLTVPPPAVMVNV